MANGTPRTKKAFKRKHSEQPKVMETMAGSFYRMIDPRRKQEVIDSRMVREDMDCTANLPDRPVNTQFNPNRYMESLGFFDERSDI